MNKGNEHHIESRIKNHKSLREKDIMIKDLSSKVSQLERVLHNATECIANINAMYEEKELAHTQKKRESKETALKAPSSLTLLFEEQVKKIDNHFGDEASIETDLFSKFKEKHLKEEIKKAHVERLKEKGL